MLHMNDTRNWLLKSGIIPFHFSTFPCSTLGGFVHIFRSYLSRTFPTSMNVSRMTRITNTQENAGPPKGELGLSENRRPSATFDSPGGCEPPWAPIDQQLRGLKSPSQDGNYGKPCCSAILYQVGEWFPMNTSINTVGFPILTGFTIGNHDSTSIFKVFWSWNHHQKRQCSGDHQGKVSSAEKPLHHFHWGMARNRKPMARRMCLDVQGDESQNHPLCTPATWLEALWS